MQTHPSSPARLCNETSLHAVKKKKHEDATDEYKCHSSMLAKAMLAKGPERRGDKR